MGLLWVLAGWRHSVMVIHAYYTMHAKGVFIELLLLAAWVEKAMCS